MVVIVCCRYNLVHRCDMSMVVSVCELLVSMVVSHCMLLLKVVAHWNIYGDQCVSFYSTSALLAMQSAVLDRGIPTVCLSVRPSVTFRYCVQTNEDTIVRFSASGRTVPLVFGEVKFIRIFAGDHPQWGR